MYGSIIQTDDQQLNMGKGTSLQAEDTEEIADGKVYPRRRSSNPWDRVISCGLVGLLAAIIAFAGLSVAPVRLLLSSQQQLESQPLLGLSRNEASTTNIGSRGRSIKNVRDDIPMFNKGAADAYDPTDNPDGYLVMLIAESKLMWKEMARKLEQVQASKPLPAWIFNYGDMGGQITFKKTMASMMQRWIHAPVNPQYLRFQVGAGSILDQISYILADVDDGVLVPGPGYPAFVSDFGVYGHTKVHIAPTQASNGYAPTLEELDECFDRSVAAGNPPKIFVICQPNNPTGTVYSRETMILMIKWALGKRLHVVSDEIYALSTFPGYTTNSAADVMQGLNLAKNDDDDERYLGDHVHIVAGLSKDWGMSGFRVGSVLTHNLELLQGLDIIGYYQSISMYTQNALTGVFEDDEFVDWYISENQRRLYEMYQALEEALDLIQVPLLPAQGTIFAWADFSALLLENQTEKELWMELFDNAKIALTSGESCFGDKPGMFRIVYTWPRGGVEAMKEFGRRLIQWKAQRAVVIAARL